MSAAADDKTPSIGISLQVALHGQRQLVLQSFIDRDCERPALDALLDKLRDAGERQYAWGQVEDIKLKIEQERRNATQHQLRIEQADTALKQNWENGSRKGDLRLTQAEIQRQKEAYAIAEGIKERVAQLRTELGKWESVLAR
jgi:hypothetical protein